MSEARERVGTSRQTKIICTLGPAVSSQTSINQLVEAGMDVARLNFSHGTHEEHANAYRAVRSAELASGRTVGVLADLQGPKIRLGTFRAGLVTWRSGDRVVITVEAVEGTAERVSTTYAGLADDVRTGDQLLVDDGNVALRVERVAGADVVCRVTEGGQVSDHKGISLPGIDVSAPALTDKDIDDLRFALSLGPDLVALSFVRHPEDVKGVRQVLADLGADGVRVIAKIEKPEAVEHLEAIVDAFDGVMMARGDLGVEMPLEQVPLVQKRAISQARECAKPVIVATQMLESMMRRSRPTRAEASDVATAVFDGADALMLSGETSVGAYPLAALETMARIAVAAEGGSVSRYPDICVNKQTRGVALASAAVSVAADIGARALVAFTDSGSTARRLSRHRPDTPLIAFTRHPSVRRQLALSWGLDTVVTPFVQSIAEMLRLVDAELQRLGRAVPGDDVVIVGGLPPGMVGTTNVHVHCIGEAFADISRR